MRQARLPPWILLSAWCWHLRLVSSQDDNGTSTLSPNLLLEEPLCGYSKRNIDEDPLRRHCLRQCILGDDGIVYPYFEEWEEYCRETAGMMDWDPECRSYLCCLFGCEVWGGDSTLPIRRSCGALQLPPGIPGADVLRRHHPGAALYA